MDEMQAKLMEAAIRMGISVMPAPVPAPAEAVLSTQTAAQEPVGAPEGASQPLEPLLASLSSPSEPVDPPPMPAEWEKELDGLIAQSGGTMTIPLTSGVTLRVVAQPKPANDAVEVSYETFKRLSRAAAILNGKVVDVVSKELADVRTKDMLDRGEGFWASPHVFVEVDKKSPIGGARPTDFGVIASPKQPPSPPPINPALWMKLSAGNVVEQVPMRIAGKVIGTLVRTTSGPLYAKTVKEAEHRLNLRVSWAMSGGYAIEREAYDKYLSDPATIIKFVRGDQVYLTSSAWIQKYGGLIRHWGTERVVMPLAGNYWLVVNKDGEAVG